MVAATCTFFGARCRNHAHSGAASGTALWRQSPPGSHGRFPWIDPGLPARFLPVPWSGTAAAELFARRHAQWADEAIAEWKQLLARA